MTHMGITSNIDQIYRHVLTMRSAVHGAEHYETGAYPKHRHTV